MNKLLIIMLPKMAIAFCLLSISWFFAVGYFIGKLNEAEGDARKYENRLILIGAFKKFELEFEKPLDISEDRQRAFAAFLTREFPHLLPERTEHLKSELGKDTIIVRDFFFRQEDWLKALRQGLE